MPRPRNISQLTKGEIIFRKSKSIYFRLTVAALSVLAFSNVSIAESVVVASSGASGYSVLHAFKLTEGQTPYGPLIQAPDGDFYGTTYTGGASGDGTVFRMSADGKIKILHSFAGSPDALGPRAPLLLASDGNFYGVTSYGGAFGAGTVFRMSTSGKVKVMHSFAGGVADGMDPYQSALIQASDGFLYGTTIEGGSNNLGTTYRISLSGDFTLLHSFAGSPSDAVNPTWPLMQADNGLLYGTTGSGGTDNVGTIFSMTTSGEVAIIHSFSNGQFAAYDPECPLIQGIDGSLYGTTVFGGKPYNSGTAFKISTSGQMSIIALFNGDFIHQKIGPENPIGSLLFGPDGQIYGTTYEGGSFDFGTLFSIPSSGRVTVIHSFGNKPKDGTYPISGVMQAADGRLLGTTIGGGGSQGDGTIFGLTLP